MKRLLCQLILLIVIIFLGFVTRIYIGSWMEFREAERLFSRGMLEDSLFHYERAIHWYVPVIGYSEMAAERIWEIGKKAEDEGKYALALSAYQGLRSSFYSVRSFYQPGRKWIDLCNDKILYFYARRGSDARKDEEGEEVRRMRDKLKKQRDPDPFWAALSILGLSGWIGATVLFIWAGIGREQKLKTGVSVFSGLMFLSCYAIWIIGMIKAH